MPVDLLADIEEPKDLLAGIDEREFLPKLEQGEPESMWDRFAGFFGKDAEKEKAKASNALVYSEMFGIAPSMAYEYHDAISEQVQTKLSSERIVTQKHGLSGAASTGAESSIIGMMRTQQVPKPFESVSQLETWVHGLTALGLDIPFMAAGALIGGGPVAGWAGAFALPMGIRQMLTDKYTKGEVVDFADFMDRTGNAVRETIKGELVGGFTGGARYMAAPWLARLAPGASAGANFTWSRWLELSTMTAAGKAVEGQIPTARDFVDNAAILLAMHAGARGLEARPSIPEVRAKLQEVFVRDGIPPKVVAEAVSAKTAAELDADMPEVIETVAAEIRQTIPPEMKAREAEPGKAASEPEIVEPGASLQAKEPPEPQDIGPTGIKNAAVDAERAAAGKEPIETPVTERPEDWKDQVKEKVDRGEIDPEDLVRQINNAVSLGEKPPAVTDYDIEALRYDKTKLKNEHAFLEGEIEKGREEGADVSEMEARRDDIEVRIDENQKATKAVGTEQARAFEARKGEMQADYSYSGMIQRAREEGVEITPEVRKKMKTLSRNVAKAQKELDDFGEANGIAQAEKAVKILRNEAGLKQRAAKRAVAKEELDAEFDDLISKFKDAVSDERGSFSLAEKTTDLSAKILLELARNRIKKGAVKAEDIIDQIHTALKNAGIEYSKREIRDIISGYGVTKEMSKEDIAVKLREAKRQMQLISALEDAKKGEAPKKSGLQRDAVSDRVRELQREVRQSMRESGVKSGKSVEEQWKTSLDAVKTRLKNQIADLAKRMETGKAEAKRLGIKYDEQADSLRKLRDKIQEVLEFAEGKKESRELSAEQKMRQATAAVERSIAEYERRLTENDLAPKKNGSTTPETPELKALKAERDLLKDLLKTLRDEAKPKKTPEEIAQKAFKTRTENQIKEYERRLREKDFAPKPKKPKRELSDNELKLRMKLDQVRRDFDRMLVEHKLANRGNLTIAKDSVIEAMNLVKALKSSYDVSAVGRQGFFAVISHPIRGFRNAAEMFRALKSEEYAYRIEMEIRGRKNYPLYQEAGLALTERGGQGSKVEELYRSRWAQAIPGIPASERAFVSFLNLMRCDLFDAMHESAFGGGKSTAAERAKLAQFANEATGRGTIKGFEQALQGLGTFMWAPKLVLSRFQMVLGHSLFGGTKATRMAIAKEYGRILTGIGIIYTVSSLLGADIETDPRSSDFGKIQIGDTRIDVLAGVSQATVFMSRIITGETKSITTGEIRPIAGDFVPYGGTTTWDVISNFLRTKLTPVLGVAINLRQGRNIVGEKVTMYDIPEETLVPLPVLDIYDAMVAEGVPVGAALGILGLFGVGIQTYEQKGARP